MSFYRKKSLLVTYYGALKVPRNYTDLKISFAGLICIVKFFATEKLEKCRREFVINFSIKNNKKTP